MSNLHVGLEVEVERCPIFKEVKRGGTEPQEFYHGQNGKMGITTSRSGLDTQCCVSRKEKGREIASFAFVIKDPKNITPIIARSLIYAMLAKNGTAKTCEGRCQIHKEGGLCLRKLLLSQLRIH